MPLYRCNKCGFVSETTAGSAGGKVPCGRCANPSTVYEAAFFVEKLAERYFAALREIEALKAADRPGADIESGPVNGPADPAADALPADLDLRNTALLATPQQHQPLKRWFEARQIEARFDHTSVDTTGFFDDAARALGDNFELFAELLDRIRYAYRNSHSGLNLELAKLSQKDAQALNTLCRQFYSHTLFARYNYQKPEKIIRLTLQTAPAVKQFFDGAWLEWFALIEVLELLRARKRRFSCARGVKIVFANEDLHELDVVALVDGQMPVCIECKSGEFRRDIDKYLRLKKRLSLDRKHFIICASDLSDEQAAGLSAMYELSFVNVRALAASLQNLL